VLGAEECRTLADCLTDPVCRAELKELAESYDRARVDYVNSLQEHHKDAASEEVQAELNALVEQCRTALRDRAEEND
jgi:hypothetical protein